jgi:uncharacterized protein (TIGR00369 family)
MNVSGLTESQKTRVEQAIRSVPFAKFLGIQLESIEPGQATMTLQIREELKQNAGVVHGGVVASLIDSATAFAILPLLKDDERTTTVDLTISYLRPLASGIVSATARVVREGGRIVVVSANLFDDTGSLAATALSTYIKLRRNAELS